MIGKTVGGAYQILEKLGEGGMGEVFEGVDIMLGRPVAIKCLHPRAAHNQELVERFRREAITLARLNHPNIATLYSFFYAEERWLMVMELAEGKTLQRLMEHFGNMPADLAGYLAGQALQALAYAHSMGVIHRDLKPANMMIGASGRLKLMDFGIARILGEESLTNTGVLVGTLKYMSPEQILGHELDGRSDIYSLGVVLYEMLSGRAPFKTPSDYELLRAPVDQEPPPIREWGSAADLPASLADAVMRALQKRPDDRFQSAMEFFAALNPPQELDPALLAPIFGNDRLNATPNDSISAKPANGDATLAQTIPTHRVMEATTITELAAETVTEVMAEMPTTALDDESRAPAVVSRWKSPWLPISTTLVMIALAVVLWSRPEPLPEAKPKQEASVLLQDRPVAAMPETGNPSLPADTQIADLLQRARQAMAQANYREPADDNALSYADAVLKLDPAQPEAQNIIREIGRHYYTTGEALHRKGKRKQAEPYLRIAGELVTTYPAIFVPPAKAAPNSPKDR